METITVFRLEDSAGSGAFEAMSWDDCDRIMELIPNYMDERPTPAWETGTLREACDHDTLPDVRFGTPSVELLQHWFPPCILPLVEGAGLEFTVWAVPAEDVFHGGYQVAFKPDRAKCIERRPVSFLHQSELRLAA